MDPGFKRRLMELVVIILVCSVLNTVFEHWVFSSIGFCLCGLLCIVRPVKFNNARPEQKQRTACRLAGVLLILVGIMLRARLY